MVVSQPMSWTCPGAPWGSQYPLYYLKAGRAVMNELRGLSGRRAHLIPQLNQTALRPSSPRTSPTTHTGPARLAHRALKASAESFAQAISFLGKARGHPGITLRPPNTACQQEGGSSGKPRFWPETVALISVAHHVWKILVGLVSD